VSELLSLLNGVKQWNECKTHRISHTSGRYSSLQFLQNIRRYFSVRYENKLLSQQTFAIHCWNDFNCDIKASIMTLMSRKSIDLDLLDIYPCKAASCEHVLKWVVSHGKAPYTEEI
jgi:hypothetical protein